MSTVFIHDKMTIPELLDIILSQLKLNLYEGDWQQLQLEWTKKFHQNLIFNAGLLKRVSESSIEKLNLPLLINDELCKLISSAKPTKPLLSLAGRELQHLEGQLNRKQREYELGLSPEEKDYLRTTWNLLTRSQLATDFARSAYPRFFKAHPSAQRLFQNLNMELQARALISMLAWIVNHMDHTDKLFPVLAQMGGRHELYGVLPSDYDILAQVVAETFRHILGTKVVTQKVYDAWERAISRIGTLMVEAGNKIKLGWRGELMREKSNGSWVQCYVNMTLDRMYVFRDINLTELKTQYSLQEYDAITPLSDQSVPFVFELSSMKSSVRFAATDDKSMQLWILECDWRIQAVHRVYFDEVETSTETEPIEDAPTTRAILKQTKKTKKKIEKKKRRSDKTIKAQIPKKIEITAAHRAYVKEGWKLLIETQFEEMGTTQRALARFFDEFYKVFFDVNPSGKRLFEEGGMAVQARALVKMMSMIVKSIDSPDNLDLTIKRLGGRHEIYNVSTSDYEAFAKAMCDTFQSVLGDKCSKEMQESWYLVLLDLSNRMEVAGKTMKEKTVDAVFNRKFGKKGDWKKSAISLSLDHLLVFRDEKMTKLRSSIPLTDVSNIDFIEDPALLVNSNGVTNEFGFVLELFNGRQSGLFLSTDNKKDITFWIEELNWRVQALARMWKEPGDDSSTTDNYSGDNDSLKLYKSLTKFKKRKTKKKYSNSSSLQQDFASKRNYFSDQSPVLGKAYLAAASGILQ